MLQYSANSFHFNTETMWISTIPKRASFLTSFKLEARDTPQISLLTMNNPTKEKEGVYTLKLVFKK